MRLSKIAPIFLALACISTLAMSCAQKQTTTSTVQTQTATVQRGNISIAITAVGNLALSQKEDLAFEIPGTVEDITVKAGDTVKKGQVLATLDTSDWDTQVTALARAVTTAQRAVNTKQNALRDAQITVTTAQYNVTSSQLAVTQAQLAYRSANDTLNQLTDVKKIQDRIDDANDAYKMARNMLTGQSGGGANIDSSYWNQVQVNAQATIAQANIDMRNLLAGTSTTVTSNVALQVLSAVNTLQQKDLAISQAQLNLDKANNTLSDAQNAVPTAQEDVKNAQDDLDTAQKNLTEARSNSPQVIAPFDGFISSVTAVGGDDVKKGAIAVTIADPTMFEAALLVNETDISKVTLGGSAQVALQSASGVTLAANITSIAPTATAQSGVVNYKVTLGIQGVAQQTQSSGSTFISGNVSPGFPPGRGGSGNFTPGQRSPGGNFTVQRPGGFASGNLTQSQIEQAIQQRQAATTSLSDVKLADGMTVTVTIPVTSKTGVLLVPNSAITTRVAGQSTVKVVKADGTIEDRAVQTGIADFQNTEITGGLSEGEKIQYTRTTGSSSSQQGNRVVIPGGGVFGR